MAWVSYFGPQYWVIDSGPVSWVNGELVGTSSGQTSLSPIDGLLPIRAEKWRATISSPDTGGIGFYFDQDTTPLLGKFTSGFPGTLTITIDVSGHLEGMKALLFGSNDITYTVESLEYDDETVRADTDILNKWLLEESSGKSWDFSVQGFKINNGTQHRANFSQTFDWHEIWWDDWQLPPNQVRIKIDAAAPVTCWLNITSGFFPDPTETVVWEEMQLQAGVNEFTFPLNDVRYPWERLTLADSGSGPYSAITSPGVTILEIHAERVAIPPDPVALLSEITPVNRFALTLEDGTSSVVLPMTSFSARLVSARPSFLQAVVPNAGKYIDEITPLANGEFFVTWQLVNQATGEIVDTREIARANLARVSEARGPRSTSISLTGNKQKTYTDSTAHEINRNHQTNGDQTRLSFSPDIKPADTLNGATIDVVQINTTATGTFMTVTTL